MLQVQACQGQVPEDGGHSKSSYYNLYETCETCCRYRQCQRQVPEDGVHSTLSDTRYETCETCCRYRHAKDRSQRMVVIPRYEPVFVEPNHKEYETQVSTLNYFHFLNFLNYLNTCFPLTLL
jgi:hypothetical protein